jgi:hypothetical protein
MPNFNTLRYVNGYYKPRSAAPVAGTVDLGSTSYTQDGYIVKYSPDGKPLWSARVGSNGADTITGVTTDTSGNVYAIGTIATRTYVYNANGTVFDMLLPNAGGTDAFIVKYNASGGVQWVARIASTVADVGWALAADSSGNITATGQGGSGAVVTAFNADGTAFSPTLSNSGGTDAFIIKYDTSGTVQWVARVASAGGDIGYGIATDSSGNVYVAGQCGNSNVVVTAFNFNGTAFSPTLPINLGGQVFIVKYNSTGTVQWLARIASDGTDIGFAIATDSSGNVYVTGQGGAGSVVTAFNFNGTAFSPTLSNSGGTDAFVVKYNTTGTVQWVARIASTATDIGYGIATDTGGNVYVTGQGGINAVVSAFSSNGSAFGTTLASLGQNDIFLVKYDTSGTVQWVTRLGTQSVDFGYGVATDGSDNVYITGQTGLGATLSIFNSNGSSFGTLSNNTPTTTDAFLIKYNSSGTVQWAVKQASVSTDVGRSVAVDTAGNVYTTGTYIGAPYSIYGQSMSLSASFTVSGTSDAFIIKYNTNGAPQWVARVAGTGVDIGYGTATDSAGNFYAAGAVGTGTATIFSANGTPYGTSLPANQCFVVKYDTSGTVQWVASIQGSVNGAIGLTVTADASGNIIVGGTSGTTATVTAYSSNGVAFGTTLANAGGIDAFLVEYNSSGTVQWVARVASTGDDYIYKTATDSDSNIYVTGQGGSGVVVTAYNSNGTAFGTTIANAGSTDTFIVKYNSSGTVQWVARIASTGADSGRGIAVDSSGNVYVAGTGSTAEIVAYSSNGVAFGTTLPALAAGTMFLVKYNSSGTVQWVTRVGGATGSGVAVDSGGNVYISGNFGTTLTVYSSNTSLFQTMTSLGGVDTWVVKYTTNGLAKWASQIGSSINDPSTSIATDAAGSVYISGSFGGTLGGALLAIINADGSTFASSGSTFGIVKFNTNGIGQWLQSIGGLTSANDVTVSSAGDVFITGQSSSGTLRVYSSDSTPYVFTSSLGAQDAYVVKYSSAQTPIWVSLITSTGTDSGFAVTTDSSANVIVAGQGGSGVTTTVYNADGTPFGTPIPTAGLQEAILVKYNTNGVVQWVTRVSSTGTDSATGVTTDTSGNIYLTGIYPTTATFYNSDGSTFGTTLTSVNVDIFIAKYNPSGTVQWVAKLSSPGADGPAGGIATDSSGNVYITGQSGNSGQTTTVFNANGTSFQTIANPSGIAVAYVVKYNTNGAAQWRAAAWGNFVSGNGIAVTSAGLVYVTGTTAPNTTTNVTQFVNSNQTLFGSLAGLGTGDGFIVAYDTAGFVQWIVRMGGTGIDNSFSIALDPSGNLYVAGSYAALMTFYNANGTAFGTTLANSGSTDSFVAKYSSTGTVLWVARVAYINADIAYGVQTDSGGNVYIAGQSTTIAVAYNADATLFGTSVPPLLTGGTISTSIVKYNSFGDVQWISTSHGGGGSTLRGIDLDSSDNIYATGTFTTSALVPSST